MSSMFEDVADFQRQILGVKFPRAPEMGSQKERWEGSDKIQEELNELEEALEDDMDIVDAVDAYIDIIYFTLGELYKIGVNADHVWQFVHKRNMEKKKGKTKRNHETDAMKPEGWQDPKTMIKDYLDAQAQYR